MCLFYQFKRKVVLLQSCCWCWGALEKIEGKVQNFNFCGVKKVLQKKTI